MQYSNYKSLLLFNIKIQTVQRADTLFMKQRHNPTKKKETLHIIIENGKRVTLSEVLITRK